MVMEKSQINRIEQKIDFILDVIAAGEAGAFATKSWHKEGKRLLEEAGLR